MSTDISQVDREGLIVDLAEMVRIASVNCFGDVGGSAPPEEGMARYLERRFGELGLEVESRDVGHGRRNVWGRLRGQGQGPVTMMAGHLDTVGVEGYDAPFEPKVEGGKIYGRGSCDMKAGLAAYLEAIRILKQSPEALQGDIIVAGVVDEEHAMIGSSDFGRNGPAVDFAIVAEPSNLAICPAHKGQVCLSIKTRGVSVHSSVPERGVNAIFHMTSVLNGLRDLAADLQARPADPMCGKPSLSVGVISGGTNVSSVPDWCKIEVDRRTIPGETLVGVLAEYQQVLDEVARTHPGFEYEICAPELAIDPFDTPQNSPIVAAILQACEEVTGKPPEVAAFTGCTDAPNFRCPAVICGAGSLAQCHSLNEYVEIDEIVSAVQIYVKTIQMMQISS